MTKVPTTDCKMCEPSNKCLNLMSLKSIALEDFHSVMMRIYQYYEDPDIPNSMGSHLRGLTSDWDELIVSAETFKQALDNLISQVKNEAVDEETFPEFSLTTILITREGLVDSLEEGKRMLSEMISELDVDMYDSKRVLSNEMMESKLERIEEQLIALTSNLKELNCHTKDDPMKLFQSHISQLEKDKKASVSNNSDILAQLEMVKKITVK